MRQVLQQSKIQVRKSRMTLNHVLDNSALWHGEGKAENLPQRKSSMAKDDSHLFTSSDANNRVGVPDQAVDMKDVSSKQMRGRNSLSQIFELKKQPIQKQAHVAPDKHSLESDFSFAADPIQQEFSVGPVPR